MAHCPHVVPLGLLSTTVIGLGGIGGTYFTARHTSKSQTADLIKTINAEEKRAENAQRRQIYTACLATFTEYFTTIDARQSKGSEKPNEDAYHLVKELLIAVGNVRLVCDAAVLVAVMGVQDHLSPTRISQRRSSSSTGW